MRVPEEAVTKGYDIHVVFSENQQEMATELFYACLDFLNKQEITYQNHKIFAAPVGPWPTPMWQFVLPSSSRTHHDLGQCTAWFMLNRGSFSVMIHPNTKKENGRGGEYEDHVHNHLWLGPPQALHIDIFTSQES